MESEIFVICQRNENQKLKLKVKMTSKTNRPNDYFKMFKN